MSTRQSSLENWKARIRNQLGQLLEPILHQEQDPSDALTDSLDQQPSWTLFALTDTAQDGDSPAVCLELYGEIRDLPG